MRIRRWRTEATNNTWVAKSNAAKTLIDAGGEFAVVLEAVGLPEIEFDQAKVDREEAAKKAQVEALQAKQASRSLVRSRRRMVRSLRKEVFRLFRLVNSFGADSICVERIHNCLILGEHHVRRNGFKTARPVARLREGRTDWYRIENRPPSKAKVYIYDEIGYVGVSAQDFVGTSTRSTAAEIELHIDSPGGDVFEVSPSTTAS